MLHCPIYELTCPIPHGMSGSPVFIAPSSSNRRVEVIGVASFAPSSEHEDNPNQLGSGFAVPIAAALVTAVQNQGGGETTMLDLVRAGQILDFGRSWPHVQVVRGQSNGEYGLMLTGDCRAED